MSPELFDGPDNLEGIQTPNVPAQKPLDAGARRSEMAALRAEEVSHETPPIILGEQLDADMNAVG